MNEFFNAMNNLRQSSISWNIENFLSLSNTDNIEMMENLFHGLENPDKIIINIKFMKVLIRSINSYTSEYVGSYLAPTHVRLEAIGLVNGVDYLFNRTDTFIRANDLDKIKELLKEFVLSNCKRKDEFMTKALRKIDVEIFGMMTYNACKQINKNNQQEVNRLGNNSKGMIIDLTGAHSRFIISKTVDLENKLKAIIKDNDEFTISYFDGFSNNRCDSDVIVIDSLVERDIIKTMFLYNPKIKISSI